jgi:ABC-type polysaccharide/polyol phosphate transport system ATPase subunit
MNIKKDSSFTSHHSRSVSQDLQLTTNGIVISVKDLSKSYKMYSTPTERMKELLHPFGKRYHRDFWALRDINLEISKGTTFGIVGQNGSGKSTLLQIITGILQPTSGSIRVSGRVSALLELGAGFNKEFTGRENVFMQGAVMGISRQEMEERFDQIEEFAGIGRFIDQPTKTYSSGMYVRLAFAVAINVDPEILIIDEALAVGDIKFKRKCYDRIEKFRKDKKTILFVSHDMNTINLLCDKAMLLNKGQIIEQGEPKYVTKRYHKMLFGEDDEPKKRASAKNDSEMIGKEKKVTSKIEQIDLLKKEKLEKEKLKQLIRIVIQMRRDTAAKKPRLSTLGFLMNMVKE